MRSWTFWDWTAYLLLGASIVFQAMQEVLKREAAMFDWVPELFKGSFLPFLTLGMFALASIIFVVRQLRRNDPPQTPPVVGEPATPDQGPAEFRNLREIKGQHYENETVVLDGKEFLDCTFMNVLFVYQGIGRIRLLNCTIGRDGENNLMKVQTNNPVVHNAWALLVALKVKTDCEFKIYESGKR